MFEYIESDLMQREYLIGIADFLLDEFERMFGRDIINRELKLVIYNDPTADFPMLITNTLPMQIRLAQTQLSYWAQTIYQLSHELGHFALSQRKKNTARFNRAYNKYPFINLLPQYTDLCYWDVSKLRDRLFTQIIA